MTLTRLLPLPLMASLLGGCVQSDSPIRILNAAAVPFGEDADCTAAPEPNIFKTGGSLDLAAGVGVGYQQAFFFESNFQEVGVTVGPDTVSGPSVNDFVVDRMDLSFQMTPALAPLDNITRPVYFTIRPGQPEESFFHVNLIPFSTLQALRDAVPVGTSADLLVSFTLRGRVQSGGPLSSNTVTFPIRVFKSNFPGFDTCPHGPVLNGVCGGPGGQDGTIPLCAPAPATTP
jgi:hypothetical protein